MYGPSLRPKLRPPNHSAASRTDDVVGLLEFDSTYILVPAPGLLISALTVSPEASLIDRENKPTSLCCIRIAEFRELSCSCDFDGRWPCVNKDSFSDCIPVVSGPLEPAAKKQKRPWWLLSSFCAFPKVINGSFCTTDCKRSRRISDFGAGRVISVLSVSLSHLRTVV